MLLYVGIGGAGSKIVDTLYQKNVVKRIIHRIQSKEEIVFTGVAVDTSKNITGLSNIPMGNVVLIGKSAVKGHGTGANVALGKRIVTEEVALITGALTKTVSEKPMAVVIFAGLGGGTGTGGLKPLAKKIRSIYNCSVIGVFVLPSAGEGRVYSKNAFENLETCIESVDGSIVLDNNVLTEKGEDIYSAQRRMNQGLQDFFRLVNESFFNRLTGSVSTVAYTKKDSERTSVKDIVEKILREDVNLRFNMGNAEKMVLIARGDLSSLFGHDFAQGWAKNKYNMEIEFEFYDEPGSKTIEFGLLVVGTKDLNGRFDDIAAEEKEKQPSELDELLKDIHSIY